MTIYDYFQSYRGFFWQWEENAEVLAIPNEATIAYRELVAEVLEKLSPQGLPPFGSLLMAIIATNPGSERSIDTVYKTLCDSLATTDDKELAHAIEFLNLLAKVPPEFKKGKKRIMLLQAVFENCHNLVSVKRSKNIVSDFTSLKFDPVQIQVKKDFSTSYLRKALKTIYIQQSRFKDVDAILEKVLALPGYTDIPELEEIPGNTETKDLAEQLIDNPKTFHVGALIKRIWSGLNIPLHSSLPSQQPLGGVADLTNKGDFDKLLISEFANDDIVFLSRLANSEVLYIHREIPPANNSMERVILMDVSLKNWGTPKAVSFATMLAIAKHPKTDIACSAFVVGNSFHPVSIDNVETIIDGLQLLEGSLHAANGLTAFFKEYPAGRNREIFFITEPSTLKHPAMAKAMSDYQPFISYLLFTDSIGNIDIYKKQQGSKKYIQHIQLPLEKLWEKTPKDQNQNRRSDRPAASYPLLFKSSQNLKALLTTVDGQVFIVTGNKVLLRLFDKSRVHKGWDLLLEKIPVSAADFEIGLSSKGEYILLIFQSQTREMILINLTSGEKKNFIFQNWKSIHGHTFVFQNQKFHHYNNKGCWTIDFSGIEEVDYNATGVPGKTVFVNRAEDLKKAMSAFKPDQNAFKNIKEIFINENDQLVFNIHELRVNSGSHLKLDTTDKKMRKLSANKINDKIFMFPDGSTIEISITGIFILKSSSDNIPFIFLPAMLDASLAVATDNAFAGNEFYYHEPQFDVILTSAGEKVIGIVKFIKEINGQGLGDAKELAINTPSRVIKYLPKTRAENIKKTLEALGAKAEIQFSRPDMHEIERISVPFFYQKYISPFIKHILNHGPQNQALS